MHAVTWRSHHALAYFNRHTGTFTGPFHLDNAPSLALTTAAANSSDLFVWTTREPQPATTRPQPPPLPWVSVFPLGSGQARTSVPSPAPWPAGEPVVTLSTGEVGRLVNGRAVQVTRDLAGFWRQHYPALRRELGRRYPKHAWPEDGATARPPPPPPPRRR